MIWSDPEQVAQLAVPGLTEASGLAASVDHPGVLYTHNDSGNPPELFAISTNGQFLAKWRIDGATNVDWEDIDRGPCAPGSAESCVYLGDIGDNAAKRTSIQLYVVREPALPATGSTLPLVRRVELHYPDAPRDAETLLVHPQTGDVYIVGKRPPTAGDTSLRPVFVARAADLMGTAPVTLTPLGTVQPDPQGDALITGGSIHPSGERLVLRTYTTTQEYRLPAGQPFDRIFATQPSVVPPVTNDAGGFEVQGEAITYDAAGTALYTTSEGATPPLNRRRCEP